MKKKPQRLGLFGGTFNPIHYGHLRSAAEVAEALNLGQIWFIPAAFPPHKAPADVTPFEVRLTDVGCFPNADRLRVVWVGVGGDVAALVSLQRSIDQGLERLGFAREKRGFTPHLTLARIRDWVGPGERRELAARLSSLQVPAAHMPVRHVAFIRSDLRPSGAVYSILSTIPLGETPVG